jgi:hypothetical protein
MYKPYVFYERDELYELVNILYQSPENKCRIFGDTLNRMLSEEFSFSTDTLNVGGMKGHKFLQENYPERYAVLYLRRLSRLPTEMNNEDPVINEIVLWRIKKGKGE